MMGGRTGQLACLVLAGGLLLSTVSPASAGPATLRWTHPDPTSVRAFRLHLGSSSRAYNQVIRLGLPDADSNGIFSVTVDLGDDPKVFVAVSAVSREGWLSKFSNERRILQPPEPLGQPQAPAVIAY